MSTTQYPYWEQYKAIVHARLELPDHLKMGHTVGMILIRVVEDAGVEEWADQLCLKSQVEADKPYEEDPWWEIFEHEIGEWAGIDEYCILVYLNHHF